MQLKPSLKPSLNAGTASAPRTAQQAMERARRCAHAAVCASAAVFALSAAAPPALAAEPIAHGARVAATCAGCHGTNGATSGNALPSLAGQPRDALLASLQAFKAGTRPATIMTQIAKGYTDEQLAELAAYFAAQQSKTAEGARP